jgi:hypothetical protein
MSVFHENMLIGASGQVAAGGISRSLRFNSADSAYLSRTPASAGNRKTWTWAGWVKRSKLGISGTLFASRPTSSPLAIFYFSDQDYLRLDTNSNTFGSFATNAVFRDCSAWYHIVFVADSSQVTSSNRLKLYVNGVEQTFSSITYPSQDTEGQINTATLHGIGAINPSTYTDYFDGYLADIYFIDGQALDPSSFTETDATTGQLIPKAYTGSYGTNGFHLEFADNSSNTATTLGKDTSGNSPANNWSPVNLSTTTGGPTSVAAASGALPIYNTTDTYGAVKGTGTRTDSNSSSIVLAIPMDGANNGTTFTDESATIRGSGSALSLTRNGDTKTSTAQSKYYGSSGYFDGTGDTLTTTIGSSAIGSGNFTIEGWVYHTSLYNYITWLSTTRGATGFNIGTDGAGIVVWYSSSGRQIASSSGLVKTNTWHHFAYVRNGSTLTAYLDGNSVGSATVTTNFSATSLCIGGLDNSSEYLTGYLSDVRIYSVAKYTGNFNPPSSTQNPTIGAGCDSLVDVPTNGSQTDTGVGGEVRGNYGTFNALVLNGNTLTNGNLSYLAGAANKPTLTTFGIPPTGKWYFEFTDVDSSGSFTGGVGTESVSVSSYLGSDANGWGYQTHPSNAGYHNNGVFTTTGRINGAGSNTILGVAIDRDAQKIWFSVNGTFVNSGAPASGTNAQYSNLPTSGFLLPGASTNNAANIHFNAGQRPFAYTAPSGFKALCTANLPAPLVTKPNTVMDVKLYTGTGSSQSITGLGFNPDFVWIKNRSSSGSSHALFDVVRGADNRLRSNGTDAELSPAIYGTLSSFDSAGFTVAPGSSDSVETSASGSTYVAWTWDAGSSTVTNTQGSITSSVRANATAGFSVITWTQSGSSGDTPTVGHGLGVTPSMIIVKSRSNAQSWRVYHTTLGVNQVINLDSTGAAATVGSPPAWSVSSTTFGCKNGQIVDSGYTYVGYAFAPVAGYSSFGSYTANASSDGPMVWLGFKPKLILIKAASDAGDMTYASWLMLDTSRDTYNICTASLYANKSQGEGLRGNGTSSGTYLDILSNGFKIRYNGSEVNGVNGQTYIYCAWAESPFNYARAR